MRERLLALLEVLSRPAVAIGGSLLIAVLAVGYAWYATSVNPSGAYAAAQTAPVTQEVDVSGPVQAAQSTDLAFQASGRVSVIRVEVGDHVAAGETLAALDSGSQIAALESAQASLEMQQAKLAALLAGTRPEQLAIDQTAVAQAQSSLIDAIKSAFVSADDAVYAKADQVFTSPRTTNAQLSITVPDSALAAKIESERDALEPVLTSWQASVATSTDASVSEANLQTVSAFLNDLTTALAETQAGGSLTATALTTYQTNVNTGRTNVSAALSALTSADTAYKAAVGALALAQAGATQNDINAQQALVDAAKASVDAARAGLSQTVIAAPVSGTITAQNANLGETAVPGVPLVSMIADGKFEAKAQVSEADIAKLKVGDAATATFDSYPGVTFAGSVTSVDPAATIMGGISSYNIKITFADNDPRLKPGLTANLRIITATKDRALLVPSSAIIADGGMQFVYVKSGKNPVKTPVTTGIVSADGKTEIMSGLTEGAQVLTFGGSAR